MKKNKTALVISNIGSPDSPELKYVKIYLKEFLSDPSMIIGPSILRWTIVNFIIIPFRAKKVTEKYKTIWQNNNSPLINYSQNLLEKLKLKLERKVDVYLFMRYGNPSIKNVIEEIKNNQYEKIVFMPLYPQYAESTTGSSLKYFFEELKKAKISTPVFFENYFFNNVEFVNLYAKMLLLYNPNEYDLILFSFHGLPLSHIKKNHNGKDCKDFDCLNTYNKKNELCYVASCYEMTRLIMAELKDINTKYDVSFQSSMTNKWTSPFTEETIISYADKGVKKILITCPSFVTDCIETIHEINIEYKKKFFKHGGTKFTLVESLNDSNEWVEFIEKKIDSNIFFNN
ncbi:MAG: ferrochelatase [Bacteroidetes bacterium GWE2_29_8]|nr:MAG: ferrochelatase [Bacteroidetes bacterium GWE2_29_8]OFY18985.1 MAG: ferrochelatase [Bacteroidetes bacterium GWF2_29_10]